MASTRAGPLARHWLSRRTLGQDALPIADVIAAYQPGVDELKPLVTEIASPFDCEAVEHRFQAYVEAGAPEDIARDVARLRPLTSSSDVIDLAKAVDWPLAAVGRLYHAVGARFLFDRLRAAGNQLSSTLHWDRLAMRRLIEDLYGSQQAICEGMMAYAKSERADLLKDLGSADAAWADEVVSAWTDSQSVMVKRADRALEEISSTGGWTLSKVAISSTQLRELAAVVDRG